MGDDLSPGVTARAELFGEQERFGLLKLDGEQVDDGRAEEAALGQGGVVLVGAAGEHDPQSGGVAVDGPQGRAPLVIGHLVEPVEEQRDLPGFDQAGGGVGSAVFGCGQAGVVAGEGGGGPVPQPGGIRVPAAQGQPDRHRLTRTGLPVGQDVNEQQQQRRGLARTGLAQQHHPALLGAEAVKQLLAQLGDDTGGQHLGARRQLPRRDGDLVAGPAPAHRHRRGRGDPPLLGLNPPIPQRLRRQVISRRPGGRPHRHDHRRRRHRSPPNSGVTQPLRHHRHHRQQPRDPTDHIRVADHRVARGRTAQHPHQRADHYHQQQHDGDSSGDPLHSRHSRSRGELINGYGRRRRVTIISTYPVVMVGDLPVVIR